MWGGNYVGEKRNSRIINELPSKKGGHAISPQSDTEFNTYTKVELARHSNKQLHLNTLVLATLATISLHQQQNAFKSHQENTRHS